MRLLALVLILAAWATAAIADNATPNPVTRDEILTNLKAADGLLNFYPAGAHTKLLHLASRLDTDATPYNQAVAMKVRQIIGQIEGRDIAGADDALHKLIDQVQRGITPSAAATGPAGPHRS